VKSLSIAIDGPAGAGKSTVARRVAKALSFVYVDTGAMYRAIAIHIRRLGIDIDDEDAVSDASGTAHIGISYADTGQQVFLNGEDVTGLLRTEEIGIMAGKASIYRGVRKKLVELQQSLADDENVVMDGRDICKKVLPEARLKIYLTADPKVRARRRYLELVEKGIQGDVLQVERDIISRDRLDMTREESPLTMTDDAVLIDSSYMDIDEVVDRVLALYRGS